MSFAPQRNMPRDPAVSGDLRSAVGPCTPDMSDKQCTRRFADSPQLSGDIRGWFCYSNSPGDLGKVSKPAETLPRSNHVTATVRTERLLLRPWRDEDVADFAALSADPAVMEFLRPLPDRAACEAWAARAREHWRHHGFGQWIVEVPGETSFIGVVGLAAVPYEAHFTPAVEVAWRLARAVWGRGYATEAARAAIGYGFGKLALAEIVAVTVPANSRSSRVMERIGMTRNPTDDFDHPNLPDGPLKRHVLYRVRNAASTA
jgi:RimJ/RimL family protein N-acetyltransferase